MPNYNASVQMPTLNQKDAGQVGEQYGGYVGKIASAVSGAYNQDKADEYIKAYNNPNDTNIFSGMKGSLRTEKLARLLLPINAELSAQYQKKAQAEKADETQIERNMEVVNARNAVPTTKPNPDIDVEAINAEIALIVDALQSMDQLKNAGPQPAQSVTAPVDQSPVLPQASLAPQKPIFSAPYTQKYQVPMPEYTPPYAVGK